MAAADGTLLVASSFPPLLTSDLRRTHRRSLTDPCSLHVLQESTLDGSQLHFLPSSGLLATTAGTKTKRCPPIKSVSCCEKIMNNGKDDKLKPNVVAFQGDASDLAEAQEAAGVREKHAEPRGEDLQQTAQDFHAALLDEEWRKAHAMLEADPNLASNLVCLTLQGEDTMVFPLAAAAACSSRSLHGGVPLPLFEALVTANPTALLHGDSRGNRVPLMIALMTLPGGTTGSSDTKDPTTANRKLAISMTKTRCIRYLLQSWSPKVLHHLDAQGNIALHYAARYCTSTCCGCDYSVIDRVASDTKRLRNLILEEMVSAYPAAAQVVNHKQQSPLHLLVTAAVAADNGPSDSSLCCNTCTIRCLQLLIQAYPKALEQKDRQGRLPLHVACASSSHPSWDVLQVLIDNYPAALACEDRSGKIPLELWIMMSQFRIVGSVAGLSFRGNQRRNSQKLSSGGAAAHNNGGDNDVILACLQECTRREQEKRQRGSYQRRFLGRVLSGLRGSGSVVESIGRKKDSSIMASFSNCYG